MTDILFNTILYDIFAALVFAICLVFAIYAILKHFGKWPDDM